MRKLAITAALCSLPFMVPAMAAQPDDPDMEEDGSDMEPDDDDMMADDADEMTDVDDIDGAPLPVETVDKPTAMPPKSPGTATPKTMDEARPEEPVGGPLTAPPVSAMTKEYPVCSRTVTDNCINPRAARGNPR